MGNRQKAILRFLDRRLIKGYLEDFSPSDDLVTLEDESSRRVTVNIAELKGIFFVKTFTGNRHHREKKSFRGARSGKRVFVRFKDGESMMGHIDGDVPWAKGFFLESMKSNGFFLMPVDHESNNIKVFVVAAAVADVATIG